MLWNKVFKGLYLLMGQIPIGEIIKSITSKKQKIKKESFNSSFSFSQHMGCTTGKSQKPKIYIEHSTETNIAEAFRICASQIASDLKIQISEQLNPSKNVFQVVVIQAGQSRQIVWNIQQGDPIITQANVQQLMQKIQSS